MVHLCTVLKTLFDEQKKIEISLKQKTLHANINRMKNMNKNDNVN